jgi:hypothetical protein
MQRQNTLACQGFMRHLLIVLSLLFPPLIFGQKTGKPSFSLQLQPEFTYHKNNYAYRWRETYTKSTFNIGIEATVRFYPTHKLFIESGAGYISRKLNTTVFLNQTALPPPRQSFTMELVNASSVSFRTLQLPINIGYSIFAKRKININLDAGFTGNFLLNTYYGLNTFKQYEGTYKKNHWQDILSTQDLEQITPFLRRSVQQAELLIQ